jgi:hypothetical protein
MISENDMAAVSEIIVEELTERRGNRPAVRRTKLKLHDKQAALVTLGRHLAVFKARLNLEMADPARAFVDELSGQMFQPRVKVSRTTNSNG